MAHPVVRNPSIEVIPLKDAPEWYEAAWSQGNYAVPQSFKEWHINDSEERNGIPFKDQEYRQPGLCT